MDVLDPPIKEVARDVGAELKLSLSSLPAAKTSGGSDDSVGRFMSECHPCIIHPYTHADDPCTPPVPLSMLALRSSHTHWSTEKLPLQNTGIPQTGVSDMATLNNLNEPSILFNLRSRFFSRLPYVPCLTPSSPAEPQLCHTPH